MASNDLPTMMGQPGVPDGGLQSPSYYPGTAPNNEVNGGLPINLDSLRDGPPGSKPFYPYSTLIRYAIKGSPHQKLLLEDIYYAIEMRFPYFRTAPPGWKNSVRHNLSLNPCFEKVPRPLTDRGKGSYWTVNDSVDPRTGVHRVRKRRAGGKSNSKEESAAYTPSEGYDEEGPSQTPEQQMQPGPVGFGAPPGGRYQPVPMQHPQAGPANRIYPYPPPFPPTDYMGVRQFDGRDEGENEMEAVNWRSMWLSDLERLQLLTQQQEKLGPGNQEWYRMMVSRLRQVFTDPSLNPALQPGLEHLPHEHAHLGPEHGQPTDA